MDNNNEKAVSLLNELLEKSYDAEKGYKKAAEDIENSVLKDFLSSYSQQRYDFGHQIKAEITSLGGKPEKGTSITSNLHRTWIDLKSALTGGDDTKVLEECERGEKAALEDYEKVLSHQELPEKTKAVLRRHHDEIRSAIVKIQELERITKKD